MPYPSQVRREAIAQGEVPDNFGELAFVLLVDVLEYTGKHGVTGQRVGDVLGALTDVEHEFYRRVATPFAEAKIKENGDVL